MCNQGKYHKFSASISSVSCKQRRNNSIYTIKYWKKNLLSMALPIRTSPSFPLSQSLSSGSFHKPLILLHQRADRLKTSGLEWANIYWVPKVGQRPCWVFYRPQWYYLSRRALLRSRMLWLMLCTEGQSESVDTALLHTRTKGSDGAASEGCG